MKKALYICLLLSIAIVANAAERDNAIRLGEASVRFRLTGADTDSASVWVDTEPIFNDMMDNETHQLIREGDSFTGKIPLETKEAIVGLRFMTPDRTIGTLLTLRQDVPTDFTIKVDSAYNYIGYESTDPDAMSPMEWSQLTKAFLSFMSYTGCVAPDSTYRSWHSVRDFELNTQWPSGLKQALDEYPLPDDVGDWFINSLKCRFAAVDILPYVKKAERYNKLKVDEPPMEAYTYLDSIDCSPTLLKYLPLGGLKSFLYALLRFPGGGFGSIGDMPVAQWQADVRAKLRPAMSEPTQLLLDLLSAMSYVEQIDINGTPLTAVQIANIQNGYSDDLGKIILAKNEKLLSSLRKMSNLNDLSAVSVSLRQYIDKMYPGRPVVVDTWNTWCAPCLDAIALTEELKKDIDTSDIVFLYISDETSPIETWRRKAAEISGEQLRISEADSRKLGEEFSLEAFPSYLFFDRDHKLIHKQTGLQGIDTYKFWLNKLIDNSGHN